MSTTPQDSTGAEVQQQILNYTIAIDQKVLAKYPEKATQLLEAEAQKAANDLLAKGAISAIKGPIRATGFVVENGMMIYSYAIAYEARDPEGAAKSLVSGFAGGIAGNLVGGAVAGICTAAAGPVAGYTAYVLVGGVVDSSVSYGAELLWDNCIKYTPAGKAIIKGVEQSFQIIDWTKNKVQDIFKVSPLGYNSDSIMIQTGYSTSFYDLGSALASNGNNYATELAIKASIGTDYIIQPGDTLSEIALETGFTVQELAEYNGIVDPNLIYAGDSLWIPTKVYDNNWALSNEYGLYQNYQAGYLSEDVYSQLTTSVSDLYLSDSSDGLYMPIYSLDNLTLDPIGAFYDSQSSVYDQALSIADRTGVLVDSSGHRVSVATLQGLDANRDGLLSIAEASGLKLVTDLNENGHLDAGELNAVTSAILSVNWNRLTLGNALMAGYEVGTALPTVIMLTQPLQSDKTQVVPNSNYRTLRDTDNLYILPYLQWINWSANQIKINKGTQNTLIGTDGNDNFDSSYYKNYASWFPTPLTNFLGGGGDDPNTSESRNIHVTYFNNTLYLNKRAA